MAKQIQAINAYRPQIILGQRVGMEDLVDFISRSTGLNESSIRQVLWELRDATLFFNVRGQAVQLEGLGTYTPSIEVANSGPTPWKDSRWTRWQPLSRTASWFA